jgi:hypothetical protein
VIEDAVQMVHRGSRRTCPIRVGRRVGDAQTRSDSTKPTGPRADAFRNVATAARISVAHLAGKTRVLTLPTC